MNAISSALSGLQAAYDRVDRDAASVAKTSEFSAYSDAPVAVDTVDIASSLVDLASARIDAAANLKVVKAANDVQKRTIDLFA